MARFYAGLELRIRRALAIKAGMRLETVTAIFARRRRCSQRDAVKLAKIAQKLKLIYPEPIGPEILALNLVHPSPVFSCPPKKLV